MNVAVENIREFGNNTETPPFERRAAEKVMTCRSYRRTVVLRSGYQQTICEILAYVKIRLAP